MWAQLETKKMKTVLNGILAPRHKVAGITLTEESDDTITLSCGKETIAVFGQRTTAEEIHKEADKWLYNKNQKDLQDNLPDKS